MPASRSRIMFMAAAGIVVAFSMSALMLYAGLTHQSATGAIAAAIGGLWQGSGAPEQPGIYPPPAVAFGIPVTLSVAGSAGVDTVAFPDGMQATLKKVEDSRCKPGNRCVWAGELAAVLELLGGPALAGAPKEVRLGELTSRTAEAGPYALTLSKVTPGSVTFVVRTAAK